METKTLRTSTILIAADGKTQVYRSRSEMPAAMRQRLQKSLHSSCAATILIADQRGRDEIMKVLRGEPSVLRGAAAVRRNMRAEDVPHAATAGQSLPDWVRNRWVRTALALLIPGITAAGFYYLLTAR